MSLALNFNSSLPELSLYNCTSIPARGPHIPGPHLPGLGRHLPLRASSVLSLPSRPGVSDVFGALPNSPHASSLPWRHLLVEGIRAGQKQEKTEPGKPTASLGLCWDSGSPLQPSPRGGCQVPSLSNPSAFPSLPVLSCS